MGGYCPIWLILLISLAFIWNNNIIYLINNIYQFFPLHREINQKSEVKIVHTSVHGVGHTFVQAAFKAFDLKPPFAVQEQKDPDPEFPTVKYPNPEEGEGVLVSRGVLSL